MGYKRSISKNTYAKANYQSTCGASTDGLLLPIKFFQPVSLQVWLFPAMIRAALLFLVLSVLLVDLGDACGGSSSRPPPPPKSKLLSFFCSFVLRMYKHRIRVISTETKQNAIYMYTNACAATG